MPCPTLAWAGNLRSLFDILVENPFLLEEALRGATFQFTLRRFSAAEIEPRISQRTRIAEIQIPCLHPRKSVFDLWLCLLAVIRAIRIIRGFFALAESPGVARRIYRHPDFALSDCGQSGYRKQRRIVRHSARYRPQMANKSAIFDDAKKT